MPSWYIICSLIRNFLENIFWTYEVYFFDPAKVSLKGFAPILTRALTLELNFEQNLNSGEFWIYWGYEDNRKTNLEISQPLYVSIYIREYVTLLVVPLICILWIEIMKEECFKKKGLYLFSKNQIQCEAVVNHNTPRGLWIRWKLLSKRSSQGERAASGLQNKFYHNARLKAIESTS